LKSIGTDGRKYKATLKKTLFNPKKKKSVLNRPVQMISMNINGRP
jgi:hypothetical protein